jgi:hypothetical protein
MSSRFTPDRVRLMHTILLVHTYALQFLASLITRMGWAVQRGLLYVTDVLAFDEVDKCGGTPALNEPTTQRSAWLRGTNVTL